MTEPKPVRGRCGFALLAYTMIIVEKRGRVSDLARRAGLSEDALYNRLTGRTAFRPMEIKALIEALADDPRMLAFFADDSRHIVVRRPRGMAIEADIRLASTAALREAIDLMQIIVATLADGQPLDHRDRLSILQEVKDAETAIANLRAAAEAPDRTRSSQAV